MIDERYLLSFLSFSGDFYLLLKIPHILHTEQQSQEGRGADLEKKERRRSGFRRNLAQANAVYNRQEIEKSMYYTNRS